MITLVLGPELGLSSQNVYIYIASTFNRAEHSCIDSIFHNWCMKGLKKKVKNNAFVRGCCSSTQEHTSSSIFSSTSFCSLLTLPVSDFENAVIFVSFFNISFSACFSFLFLFPTLFVQLRSLSRFVTPLFSFSKLYLLQILLAHKIE